MGDQPDPKTDKKPSAVDLNDLEQEAHGSSRGDALAAEPGQPDRDTVTLDPEVAQHLRVRPGKRYTSPKPYPNAPYWALRPRAGAPWNDRLDSAREGLPRRYRFGKEIGRGGQGRILTVFDTDLGRPVALKTVLPGVDVTGAAVRRIIHEVQTTGQLEHPNIIPVYDLGQLATGEIFYSMKLLSGRTLASVIRGLATGDEEIVREFSCVRLINILQQICQGVAFAHDRGVIHRDLKPSNIMLGEYGEVTVMDWGCAKLSGSGPCESEQDQRSVNTHRTYSEDRTIMGTVKGTPAYMAPEQAAGNTDKIDERSDVYAIGAIIYEILAHCPPFDGEDLETRLDAVQHARLVPPRERAPHLDIPEELEEVCLRCLARSPAERYQSSRELHDELEAYLAGTLARERQQKEANILVERAQSLSAQYRQFTTRSRKLETRISTLRYEIQPWESVDRKQPLWRNLKDLERLEAHRIMTFGAATNMFHQALSHDPLNEMARSGLADLYWSQYEEAERRRDVHDMIYFESVVREFDDGRYVAILERVGTVSITSEPSGADVRVLEFKEVNQRLELIGGRAVGKTPVRKLTLARGSYLLIITHPGYRDTRVPVFLEKQPKVSIHARLTGASELGEEYVHIPAGPFLAAGDPLAPSSRELTVRMLGDYAVSRSPVTHGQYAEFLEALGNPEEVEHRRPRATVLHSFHWFDPEKEQGGIDGGCGSVFASDWPVFGISWEDAVAYCRWRSEVEGGEVRLPTEYEWEKAARGVDGRYHPWGDTFDPTFCKMWESRDNAAMPEPVGSFPVDTSPYGVRDVAGCISEWCSDWFNERLQLKLVKGGGWNSTQNQCRIASRHGEHVLAVSPWVGFRTVRIWNE